MPPGYRMQASNEFWVSWSQRRKIRFIRTVAIALVLLFFVGRCAFGGDSDTVETADTTTTAVPEVTTTTNPMPTAMLAADVGTVLPEGRYIAGVGVAGDQIMVIAGLNDKRNSTDTIWRFNPADGAIAQVGTLPLPLHAAATTGLGGRALVMGGAKGDSVYKDVFAVDADGNVEKLGALPTARAGATAVTTGDGATVYVVGGYDGSSPTNEVLMTTDGVNFTPVATLIHPVRYPAVAIEGRSLWVMGGEYDNVISASVQRIDLDAGTVTEGAPLPAATSRGAGVTIGSSLFLVGGRTPSGVTGQILRYEGFSGGFIAAGALPAGRSDAGFASLGNRVWLFGGQAPETVNSIVELTAQ